MSTLETSRNETLNWFDRPHDDPVPTRSAESENADIKLVFSSQTRVFCALFNLEYHLSNSYARQSGNVVSCVQASAAPLQQERKILSVIPSHTAHTYLLRQEERLARKLRFLESMSVVGVSRCQTSFLPAASLRDDYATDFFCDFRRTSKSLRPRCLVTGISFTEFEPVGMPRNLPPVSSPEFNSFRIKYELDRMPHPYFFSGVAIGKAKGASGGNGADIQKDTFGIVSKWVTNPLCSVSAEEATGNDAAGTDDSSWLWWDVSTRQQKERFHQAYGWMASAPTATNFSCVLRETESTQRPTNDGAWVSDPFVLYW